MSDIVFILGAGASAECGGPLMWNFLDKANDLLRSGTIAEYRESFERVFNAIGGLQAVHSKAEINLQNIESVFTAFEMAKIIKRLPGTDTDCQEDGVNLVIRALKQLIAVTLEESILFRVDNKQLVAPAAYFELAKLLKFIQERRKPA